MAYATYNTNQNAHVGQPDAPALAINNRPKKVE